MYLLIVMLVALAAFAAVVFYPRRVSAHCDTMDGPTVKDGKLALERNDLNYALKWIAADDTEELCKIFAQSIKVRALGPDAEDLADRFFLESLVRIHRAGEGAPFEGLKPSGTPVDEKIVVADKCVETGVLGPLIELVVPNAVDELKHRFAKVMSLKNYDPDDVGGGRAYVQAYVSFVKFAEGEDHDHHRHDVHGLHHH